MNKLLKQVSITQDGQNLREGKIYWLDPESGFPDDVLDEDGHVAGFFNSYEEAARYANERRWELI